MSDQEKTSKTQSTRLTEDQAISFNTEQIKSNSVTDFDVYLKTVSGFTLYAPAPYRWDVEELKRLIADGYDLLYYSTRDQQKFESSMEIGAFSNIDLTLPPEKRILEITDVGMEYTKFLYDQPLSRAALSKGREIAGEMVRCIQEDPSCVAALGLLANHDYYTFYHSARVSAYATSIAFQMSMSDRDLLAELALGCLLHDIGKSKIGLEILNKPGALTESEMATMRSHPELGHKIVEPTVLSQVPREIILHHHERIDGGGYPHAISKAELLMEVRIAAFADIFDALTTNRPYQKSRTKFEAMDLIKNRLLNGLDSEVYKAMVEILNSKK